MGLTVGEGPHAVDEEADQVGKDEGDDQDDDHLRKVFVDEGECVAVPVVDDVLEGDVGDVVLRGTGKKEHYCGISDF